jgi:hypothetical protein
MRRNAGLMRYLGVDDACEVVERCVEAAAEVGVVVEVVLTAARLE